MKRRDLLRLGLMSATVLAGTGAAGLPQRALARAQPASVYELEFPDPDGQSQSMARFLGKPMVLNFWATWCPPCVREMPDLDALQAHHPHVSVVGLALDTADNVIRFGQRVPVSYPLLIAGHGGIRLMKEMGNTRGGLPFTLVFDAAGQPLRHFMGQIDPDELGRFLEGILPA